MMPPAPLDASAFPSAKSWPGPRPPGGTVRTSDRGRTPTTPAERRGLASRGLRAPGVAMGTTRSTPFGRRSALAFVAVALLLGAVSLPAPAQGASGSSPENTWVNTTLGKMTLEEKVGQLFVVNCFGASVRDPDPA